MQNHIVLICIELYMYASTLAKINNSPRESGILPKILNLKPLPEPRQIWK